jgi:hypothetical protein
MNLLLITVERTDAGTVLRTFRDGKIETDIILTPATEHLGWLAAKSVAGEIERTMRRENRSSRRRGS